MVLLLGPDFEEGIPRSCTESISVVRNAEAADSVLVALKSGNLLALESVPDMAVEIVVAGEHEAARDGVGDGGDSTDAVAGVVKKLSVGSDVVKTAGGVVGTGTEGVAVGEGGDGVDVGFVAGEGVGALAGLDIPDLGGGVASSRNEDALVGRDSARHDVTLVSLLAVEFGDLGASLNVPKNAGHVTGGGDDLLLIEETAAREEASVGAKLTADSDGELSASKVVNRANVVETSASNEAARGGESAGHDPRRSKRNSVNLVRGDGIPNQELAVLGSRNEVRLVLGPVHGINLSQVTLQSSSNSHRGLWEVRKITSELLQVGVIQRLSGALDLLLEALGLLASSSKSFSNVVSHGDFFSFFLSD